ncbi:MAG: hypothetical protein JXJ22_09680 [Bacteroidales bacterium]|nr:hypothetical protein [Bacteroidales bacterium]
MSGETIKNLFENLETQISGLNRVVIGSFNQTISEHLAIIEKIKANILSLKGINISSKIGKADIDQILNYHNQNLEILNRFYTDITSETFIDPLITKLKNDLHLFYKDIPDVVVIEYSNDYFKNKERKTITEKTILRIEKWHLQIKKIQNSVANRFRRIFRLKTKTLKTRTQRVNFRSLVEGCTVPLYFNEIGLLIQDIKKQIAESSKVLFDLEYAIISGGYNPDINKLAKLEFNFTTNFEKALSDFCSTHKQEFFTRLEKSGSLLSMAFWVNFKRRRGFKKSFESLRKTDRIWQSTFFAFFEDWRFREKLYSYLIFVKSTYLNVESIYSKRVFSSLIPEVGTQIDYTKNILQNLPDPENTEMEPIRRFLVAELYKLKKEKIKRDQNIQAKEAAEDIPRLIQKLENEILIKLEDVAKRVGVVKNPEYHKGVKQSDIYYFSPKEFIEFEILPSFKNENARLRTRLAESLETIVNEFNEYDQILDFYLDSAIALTEKPGVSEQHIIDVFKEGLQRILKISNKISDLLKSVLQDTLSEIAENVNKYIFRIEKLEDNSNIINIYTRLLKSKALIESKNKRMKIIRFVQKTYEKTNTFLKSHLFWLRSSYADIRKKLKLDTSSKVISSEISNYLSDIQKRIYKLPIIYQHVFENAPIKEFNLFLSREDVINKLNAAYNDWGIGNFAATLLVGENGSGKSSLLHYYSKTLKSKYPVLNFHVSGFYYLEEDYFTLLNEIFNHKGLKNDQDVNEYVSSLPDRRIIIVDGLERLFLRKLNGFVCLQKLLSLIVSTNSKLFWICSVSLNASVYLNKTSGLSEYFDYTINIDSLTSEQIKSIILKRNRISGYQVKYLNENNAGDGNRQNNSSQKQLEEEFFNELTRFADSNISLSLIYWLQSINTVKGDDIFIGKFIPPDFDFLENISPEKAFCLLLVLLHGKLSVEQHALISNQNYDQSYRVLTILKEDSILIKQDGYYILNGILYRHVIKLLKNRNLIH